MQGGRGWYGSMMVGMECGGGRQVVWPQDGWNGVWGWKAGAWCGRRMVGMDCGGGRGWYGRRMIGMEWEGGSQWECECQAGGVGANVARMEWYND